MKRREFIRNGTAAGIGVMGLSGCATLGGFENIQDRLRHIDMASYFGMMNRNEARAGEFQFQSNHSPIAADDIGRSIARTLGTTSIFRDMPLEAQLHPGMQRRMWKASDQIHRTVFEDSRRILTSGLGEEPAVVDAIRSKQNPGMSFLEQFDRDAAQCRVSSRKRFRLRSIGTEVIRQMQHQTPQRVFEEAYAKVEQMQRTAIMAGSVEEAERRVAHMRGYGRRYERSRKEVQEIVLAWQRYGLAQGQQGEVPPVSPYEDEGSVAAEPLTKTPVPASEDGTVTADNSRAESGGTQDGDGGSSAEKLAYERGLAQGIKAGHLIAVDGAKRVMKAGGWTMGISAITAAVGLAFFAVNPVFTVVVGGTVAAALLISGIIILSVGSAQHRKLLNESGSE